MSPNCFPRGRRRLLAHAADTALLGGRFYEDALAGIITRREQTPSEKQTVPLVNGRTL